MSLQDISPIDPKKFTDPKTGLPYGYGTPEYLAAVGPYLTDSLQHQAEQASNARGTFYSGPAMSNEQQAAEELMGNMAQEGARQSLQKSELQQQEKFQEGLQKEQNQANADAQKAMAGAAAKSGAVNAGIGGLSNIGGTAATLGLMKHFGLLGKDGGGSEKDIFPNELPADQTAPDAFAPATAESFPGMPATTDYSLGMPAGSGVMAPDAAAEVVGAPEVASSGEAVAPSGLGGLGSGALNLGAGALGSYGGTRTAGAIQDSPDHQWGGSTARSAESAAGGTAGGIIGSAFGPAGTLAGSYIGSAGAPIAAEGIQNEITHPLQGGIADLALGPLGPLAMGIPGFSNGLSQAGDWLGKNLNPGNWF